ncbi:MAG: GAF domain-containing protein, partial [Chloroflexi bacterium]
MAKKASPVNKTIKKKPSKAKGVKIEKPSFKTTLRKHSNGKRKADNKPSSKQRVPKTIKPKTISLEQQLAQRNAELAIINSVQAALAAELNIQGIYEVVGEKIRDIFDKKDVGIRICDPQTGMEHFPYTYENGKRIQIDSQPLNDKGFSTHVYHTRQTLVVNKNILEEVEKYGSYILPGTAMPKSQLMVPLVAGDQARGLIEIVDMDREHAFNDSDVRLLQTLANSMSAALENARLFDETNRDARESAALNEVGRDISSTLDLPAVMERIASHARELLKAETSAIFLPEAGGTVFMAIVAQGVNAEEIKADTIQAGEGIIGTLAQQAKAEFINDTSKDPRALLIPGTPAQSEERLMVAPLLTGEKVSGVMAVWRAGGEAFVQADLEFLEELSLQAAIAIKNASLFDEIEQRAAELAIINSVQEGLASKLDFQVIIELVGDKIRDIFDAQAINITQYDADQDLFSSLYTMERGVRHFYEPMAPGPIFRHIVETRESMLFKTIAEMNSVGAITVPGTESSKSGIYVPLVQGKELMGVIALENVDRENAFTEADLRLLTTLANSMSVALENARLFDETQRLLEETEQRAAELAIINSVQEGLARKLDLQEIVDLVGEKIGEIFAADTVSVGMYDAEHDSVFNTYYVDRGQRIPIAEGPAPRPSLTAIVIDTHEPLLVGTSEEMMKLGAVRISREGEEKDRNEAYLGVPILANKRAIGAVSVQSYKQHAFDQSDLRLLQTLANSMSVALENARLFDETQRLLKVTEERNAELAVINSVQQALAAELDLQGIYDAVGDKIRDIFDAQTVIIGTLDHVKGKGIFNYFYEKKKRFYPDPVPFSGMMEYMAKNGEMVVINENMRERNEEFNMVVPAGEMAKSGVWMPIKSGNLVKGVITLQNIDHENAFHPSDVRLLETLANSMSIALENARLFDETQQRNAELAIINSVQEGLASKLDMQAIYDLLGDKLREIFKADTTFIAFHDEGKEKVSAVYYRDQDAKQPFTRPYGKGLYELVVESGKPLLIGTAEESSKLGSFRVTSPGETRDLNETFMGVPIVKDGKAIGAASVQSYKQHAYNQNDLRLLTTLTNAMSAALENARLFDETQRLLKETEQRAAELAIINTISTALAGELDLNALIELVGEQIRSAFKADIAYVALLDEESNKINFPYQYGEQLDSLQYGEGLTSKIIQSGQPLLINQDNVKRRAELGATRVGIQARSYRCMPISVNGQAIGVISVQSIEQENMFTEDDQRLLG